MLLWLALMMPPPSVPWKVLSSQLCVGMLTENWCLDTADRSDGEALRCFRVDIGFDSPFASPPVVHLGLTGFDIDQRDPARLTLKATQITETGFQAEIWTWAGTRVYAVTFQWMAIGP